MIRNRTPSDYAEALVVLPVNRLHERFAAHHDVQAHECPECLSSIPDQARRCAFRTAVIAPAPEPR